MRRSALHEPVRPLTKQANVEGETLAVASEDQSDREADREEEKQRISALKPGRDTFVHGSVSVLNEGRRAV